MIIFLFAMFTTPKMAYGETTDPISSADLEQGIGKTETYLLKTVTAPVPGSVGGEWTVIGLARGEAAMPANYFEQYYRNAEAVLVANKGVLSVNKYSEYSRLILAMTAIGKNPTNVAGYDLIGNLADFERVKKQGINGPSYALLALDSKGYEVPQTGTQQASTSRESLIAYLLGKEFPGGGFALGGSVADPDITAIVLQALAPYQEDADVRPVIQRALAALSSMRTASGGFASYGVENAESLAQTVLALTSLGIDPNQWNGGILKELLSYQTTDGGFRHLKTGESDLMATEQAYLALVASKRFAINASTIFQMKDLQAYKVMLNGTFLQFDQPPVNRNSRILVPMRSIFEALGAEIQWDNSEKKVTGILGGRTVNLTIGQETAFVDGVPMKLDSPAIIVNGRTLVPVRFIAESLEASVDWEPKTQTVLIEKH